MEDTVINSSMNIWSVVGMNHSLVIMFISKVHYICHLIWLKICSFRLLITMSKMPLWINLRFWKKQSNISLLRLWLFHQILHLCRHNWASPSNKPNNTIRKSQICMLISIINYALRLKRRSSWPLSKKRSMKWRQKPKKSNRKSNWLSFWMRIWKD